MSQISSQTAAEILGVSAHEVRRLAAEGRFEGTRYVGRSLLLESEAVHRLARHHRRRGRPWSERVAWAALSLLSGKGAMWLSSSERARLKHRLRNTSAADLPHLAMRRAEVRHFRARTPSLQDLAELIVPTATSALDETQQQLGLTDAHRHVDGYVPVNELVSLQARFGLIEDPKGNVTLRTVTVEDAFVGGAAPRAAVALDLAGSLSTRESAAGTREVAALLEQVKSGR